MYINCFERQNKNKEEQSCSEFLVFMYSTGESINNLFSYCGLVVARMIASEKDVPVHSCLLVLPAVVIYPSLNLLHAPCDSQYQGRWRTAPEGGLKKFRSSLSCHFDMPNFSFLKKIENFTALICAAIYIPKSCLTGTKIAYF